MRTKFGKLVGVAAAVLTVMAAASAFATVLTPMAVTGFNCDLIVEGPDGTAGSFDYQISSDTDGPSFYGQGLGIGTGLVAGTNTSACNADATFTFQSFSANNALRVDGSGWMWTPDEYQGTLQLVTPGKYSDLAVFASFGTAANSMNYKITYADDTTKTGSFSLTGLDWCSSTTTYAAACSHRAVGGPGSWALDTSDGTKIYELDITGIDTSKSISSITFSGMTGYTTAGIFALSGAPVPEPGTISLLSAGVIGLLAYAWRRRK